MEIKEILDFVHHVEKLKQILRHSWLSDGRQESVAEHTWRMSLMAILLVPELERKVDLCKALKMIAVHDLSEVDTVDVPAFLKSKRKKQKEIEKESMRKLKEKYDDPVIDEIYDLWWEYEEGKTPEAKFAKALDKVELRIQHNEADIKTWNNVEFPRALYVAEKFCEHDRFLKEFNESVVEESIKKIKRESSKNIKEIERLAEKLKRE